MSLNKYDCTEETQKHIDTVRNFVFEMIVILSRNSAMHDRSKLQEPEKSIYDEFTPLLKDLTYGSAEYFETLKEMKPALEHHYKTNRHHPEHYERGINEMSLLDLCEMLADWKAATLRHENGDIRESLEINQKRFGISEQLMNILRNTLSEMNW